VTFEGNALSTLIAPPSDLAAVPAASSGWAIPSASRMERAERDGGACPLWLS